MRPAKSPRAGCSASSDLRAPDNAPPQGPRLTYTPSVKDRVLAKPKGRLRLALLALVAIGLVPGTVVQTTIGQRSDPADVTITPLDARDGVSGDLTLTGAWELTAGHGWFGGFSALVADSKRGLIAGTDRGFLLDLDLSGASPRAVPDSFRFVGISDGGRKEIVDLESLAHDPATQTLWAGFENDNLILRLAADGTSETRAPREMARWSPNSGPETMERLADGRFLIIAEGPERGSDTLHQALLYPTDPIATGKPTAFHFAAPPDYDPVDANQLPDGRMLILLRRVAYALPARFDTAIAIADPRTIRAGQPWQARIIQRLTGGVFADNFEGLAYVPSSLDPARGSLWLIADDNFSVFQRNILVRFDWNASAADNEKAPGTPSA